MSNRNPKRILPPESQAWGRDVDRRIQDLEKKVEFLENQIRIQNKFINTVSNYLGRIQEG